MFFLKSKKKNDHFKVLRFNMNPKTSRNIHKKIAYHATSKTTNNKLKIEKTPHRVLDAPNVLDDFYSNVMDWGIQDLIVVCLTESV